MPFRLWVIALALLVAGSAFAQEGGGQATPAPRPAPAGGSDPPAFEALVVVTASRVEQQLVNAPAAVSVVTGATIQASPGAHIGDLLRALPGVNVTQVSARDVNLTTRGATSTVSTSQLALVDGRSIYLDFFGMVMWDLVPTNANEIKQIEVIRGPASAVWGANAMSGVVNVITLSPRELVSEGRGSSLTIGFGAFDRAVTGSDDKAGLLFSVNGSHARAVDDRWSYKVSAGYFTQDPLPRPTGTLPNAFRTPYPSFTNEGTSQPKLDGRVDYDLTAGGRVTVASGVAGTAGLMHTSIGPFNIARASRMSYVAVRYEKGGRRAAFFANHLQGHADNLVARGPTGAALPLDFDTKTVDAELADIAIVGGRHVVSFGGNFRHNTFAISLAPAGGDRTEGGAYAQAEMFLSDRFRLVLGGRVDKFSSVDAPVLSPRTTFMYKPAPSQTIRVSFNRAFRAPSFVNNNISSTTILNEIDLSAVSPALARFVYPIAAVGNANLKQETMTAYEIGYTGAIRRRATVTAAVYWNTTKDGIYFRPVDAYSAEHPPPGWPLPAATLTALAAMDSPVVLPSRFTYLNLGTVADKGLELGIDASVNQHLNMFTNYSFQARPRLENFPAGTGPTATNWPAKHRFNTGFTFTHERYLGNLSLNYTDSAYWQDVLDFRFAGATEAFTLINAGAGLKWQGGRVVTSVKVTNLANRAVMQHVFGDVLKRQIVGEVRFHF